MTIAEREIMTVEQAAARLGITVSAVLHAIRDGRLPATRHGIHKRAAWELRAKDVRAYAERQGKGDLLTAAALARRSGYSRARIEQLTSAGAIRPVRRERKRVLFDAGALDVLAGRRGTTAGTTAPADAAVVPDADR